MTKASSDVELLHRLIEQRASEPVPARAHLGSMLKRLLARREIFLSRAARTPCYLLDLLELQEALVSYQAAFSAHVPHHRTYYAIKVNHHPFILEKAVQHGFGLDASSKREVQLGLAAGCADILFTGPGKSLEELSILTEAPDKIRVNIDSFGELSRLQTVARAKGLTIHAGVRVSGRATDRWSKFGIPLSELRRFYDTYTANPAGVCLEGIQFHSSWNKDAGPYEQMMHEVSHYLRGHFQPSELSWLKYIDCGGGFRPHHTEGTYAWKLPLHGARKALDPDLELPGDFEPRVYEIESVPLSVYAKGIGAAAKKHFGFLSETALYTEPGRVLCNNAFHVLLRVVDKKADNVVILDGGINLIGWERFEHDYFPVLNLTRPSIEKENDCRLYGPLCMPQDQWGFSYFGEGIEEGDILLVPYQGALTYSLAQEFIHPIAPVVSLP